MPTTKASGDGPHQESSGSDGAGGRRTLRRHPIVRVLAAVLIAACACCEPAAAAGQVGGCQLLPYNNIWNTPVDGLPVDPNSAAYVDTIGADANVHPDFGSGLWNGGPIGIPFVDVPDSQPGAPVSFLYAGESDPGPYPIPPDAPIEGGSESTGDRHVLVVERDACVLYELFDAYPQPDGSWTAGSGAVFDLDSNALRPETWTSADAAGLPMLPGLVTFDEAASGEITHALRFTAPQTRRAYVWPARHFASSLTGPQYPPMGQRFRLKSSFAIGSFAPEVQAIMQALKTYGMMLADNGSAWFLSGAPDPRWNNDNLQQLRQLSGSDFEAVDVSSLMISSGSGEALWDSDGDGIPDHLDADDDNDGLSDLFELNYGLNPRDGSDCPTWICPTGSYGWRLHLLRP